jgi:hypothetical protein
MVIAPGHFGVNLKEVSVRGTIQPMDLKNVRRSSGDLMPEMAIKELG